MAGKKMNGLVEQCRYWSSTAQACVSSGHWNQRGCMGGLPCTLVFFASSVMYGLRLSLQRPSIEHCHRILAHMQRKGRREGQRESHLRSTILRSIGVVASPNCQSSLQPPERCPPGAVQYLFPRRFLLCRMAVR